MTAKDHVTHRAVCDQPAVSPAGPSVIPAGNRYLARGTRPGMRERPVIAALRPAGASGTCITTVGVRLQDGEASIALRSKGFGNLLRAVRR